MIICILKNINKGHMRYAVMQDETLIGEFTFERNHQIAFSSEITESMQLSVLQRMIQLESRLLMRMMPKLNTPGYENYQRLRSVVDGCMLRLQSLIAHVEHLRVVQDECDLHAMKN
ncbi:hypothetical protein AB9X29_003747 [Vibrio vulnificus]